MNIPDSVFDKYFDGVDWMIDNPHIGQTCTVIYPSVPQSYSGPISKPVGMGGSHVSNNGQVQDNIGSTPTRDTDTTSTIQLRIYWTKKDWLKITNVNIPDADIMVIGYLSDLSKLKQAKEIRFSKNDNDWSFTLAGEPFPWGFKKDRYFVGYMKRS